MDDLRKEFEELMKKDEDDCGSSCETPKEDYADYIIELTTIMLVPDRCGIYFSKKDFRSIGLSTDLSISLKQRSRMITDLLKSIFTHKEMVKTFGIIHTLIDDRIATYTEFGAEYPSTKELFDVHTKKANTLKARLDRILSENTL